MPDLEKILEEARNAVHSGEAATGTWPPKLSANAVEGASQWWGADPKSYRREHVVNVKNNNQSESSTESFIETSDNLTKSTSLDEFLSTSGPQIRKTWEMKEDEKLKQLKKEARKSQIGAYLGRPTLTIPSRNDSHNATIDPNILTEAFNYGKKETRVARITAASEDLCLTGKLSSKKFKNPKPKRIRRRSASKMKMNKQIAAYDSTAKNTNEGKSEIDSLVKNFEEGINLKALRRELEKSKQSLSNSDTFIRTAAKQWFN